MADRERIPLWQAKRWAAEIVEHLAPCCERIEIAGSIRRGKADVGDVEIVAIPKTATTTVAVDMFDTRDESSDLLHERCVELLAAPSSPFDYRRDKNGRIAFGSKYKRLLYRGFPLDLFVTSPECWGCVFLLRTGPAEFNLPLVLKRSKGGWLPRGLFFRDGRLWQLPPPYDADLVDQAEPIDTPEEQDVFAAMGFAYVPPEQRSDRMPAGAR